MLHPEGFLDPFIGSMSNVYKRCFYQGVKHERYELPTVTDLNLRSYDILMESLSRYKIVFGRVDFLEERHSGGGGGGE